MSDDSPVIERGKSIVPGTPYAVLRTQAIAQVQRMSGQIWTDYNFSDPGVTTIEQLCYALTELPYRASLPVQDLLSAPGTARVQLRRQGLFPAWSILPCNPVTANDLRRLIVDRVSGVANAWFTPVTDTALGPAGLYDLAILGAGGQEDDPAEDERLIRRVLRCYAAHRALCEDVRIARVLRPLETVVHARIQLDDRADPSATLAAVFFALGLFLAPEPRRTSLAQRQALDPQSTDVFLGPLMLRGFITDEQLTDLPAAFTANELGEVLAEVTGVLTFDEITVQTGGRARRYVNDELIEAPEGAVARVRTTPRDGRFSIEMYRRDVRCDPDPAQVRRRLAELWKQQRRTYPLRTEYADFYRPAAATHWDLASYVSVQTQFPAAYGIGAGGLPSGADALRQAQAKQFKGYLMPFDQLLADYFSQLAFVRDLYSVEAGGGSTYAHQSLRPIVPDVAPLLSPGYDAGLARLTAEADPVDARRDAILTLLLSFYALQLEAAPPAGADPREAARLKQALIRAKQALLGRGALATRDRGRGLDYMRRRSDRSLAGAETLSRLQLGLLDAETPHLADEAPVAVDNPAEASFGRRAPSEVWREIEQGFRPLSDDPAEAEHQAQEPFGRPRLTGHRVPRDLLLGLHEPGRYRVGVLERDTTTVVLVFSDGEGGWWIIAEVETETKAWLEWRAVVEHAAQVRERARRKRLFLVEWILLRHARAVDARDHARHRFDFRISAIVSAGEGDEAAGWRTQATNILRANTPAHVALDVLFLDPDAMARFEILYARWTDALRSGPARRTATTSAALERFLDVHTPRPPAAPPVRHAADAAKPQDVAAPADPAAGAGPAPTAPLAAPLQPLPDKIVVESAPAGAVGFDTDRKLDAKTAAAFAAAGFTFAVRYLSRTAPGKPSDLGPEEARAILEAGLALMVMQNVASAGWSPTPALGGQYGEAAAANARAAGLPDETCLWLVLEDVAEEAQARNIVGYCGAWCRAVAQAGYTPGLYVGADGGLNSAQLAAIQPCALYWRSGPKTPDVARYGYAMLQTINPAFSLDGVPYDRNAIQHGLARRTPLWAVLREAGPSMAADPGPAS